MGASGTLSPAPSPDQSMDTDVRDWDPSAAMAPRYVPMVYRHCVSLCVTGCHCVSLCVTASPLAYRAGAVPRPEHGHDVGDWDLTAGMAPEVRP